MNYLRGAVSAISAPYQYYKDINPATLTGAIDVIVINRPRLASDDASQESKPNKDGDMELACSPFHVRFGKWQVLRPADKKVNVFVNGNLIPFSMKIGDAGEAFFIFETDEDVPEEIVTSPLLEATRPGQSNAQVERTGRFGAKEEGSQPSSPAQQALESQEPDFLDLDATSKAENALPSSAAPVSSTDHPDISVSTPPSQEHSTGPSLLTRTAEFGKAALGVAREVERSGKDKMNDQTLKDAVKEVETEQRGYFSDGLSAVKKFSPSERLGLGAQKGDEVLPSVVPKQAEAPKVTYGHDIVYDTEGYHSGLHGKEGSDMTVTNGDSSTTSEPSDSGDLTPGPSRSPSPELHSIPFPRATSEPPPEVSENRSSLPVSRFGTHLRASTRHPIASHADVRNLKLTLPDTTEEYSWEWGNFPQKTPVWSAFDNLDRKGKGRMSPDEELESDYWSSNPEPQDSSYGSGGLLTVDRRDPTRFRVFIEGKTVEFELSLIPPRDSNGDAAPGASTKTRRRSGTLGGKDEVEDDEFFNRGKVNFSRFLEDDQIVKADNLTLRWAGDMYITREDGSPLMAALTLWREAALTKDPQLSSRPVSPDPDADRRLRRRSIEHEDTLSSGDERPSVHRAVTVDQSQTPNKPSSSSWVRWWSRSRQEAEAGRPELRPLSSAPGKADDAMEGNASPRATTQSTPSGSGSALLNSPGPSSVGPAGQKETEEKTHRKRFAKTLRLTSEQLKTLNLKPGANTITFSLSATGVAACTARIFVWDHTDQIVISDIDGTITKSDALGHVFTMIGRDWTHLGVAKLYTDICRNGYKIMYLTSRAIGQADSTRDYLKGIKQNDYQLPEGPVIMSPDRLMASLHREVIMRKPEVFKMACLRDIQRLFGTHNAFYAGFGNRITDALSYRSVNVPSSRIFTIDSSGEVKMELLELAGYKSSYIHMTDLVDQMFPPINRKWAPEFTDFNYWKAPIADITLPDLAPPSPALSARSDTSNQSTLARLRNFSLVSSRQTSRMSLPPPVIDSSESKTSQGRKDVHLRQMSSLERLSSTLASLRQTASVVSSPGTLTPTSEDSGSEDDEDLDVEKGTRHRRRRRRSVSSMPGSLPGSSSSDEDIEFGVDDSEHEGDGYGYDGENEEEAAEEAFDEDFLATGEMESVPFL